MSRELADADCDELFHCRLLTTWRGAPFEILAVEPDTAVLALTSGNAEQAAALALTPAGRHAWRAEVPRTDLGDLTEETRQVGVQPQFG